jgi:hypothetical protein
VVDYGATLVAGGAEDSDELGHIGCVDCLVELKVVKGDTGIFVLYGVDFTTMEVGFCLFEYFFNTDRPLYLYFFPSMYAPPSQP